MNRVLIVSVARLAALLSLAALLIPAGVSAQDRDGSGEQAMLEAINSARLSQGIGPLARDGQLDAAAARHSAEMAERDVLEHVSQASGSPADRVHATGLAIGEIAENVAMHHTTAAAQQSLEQSEAHLGNMLNPRFTHVGIASVRDATGQYVTQVFGRIEASAPEAAVAQIVQPQIVQSQIVQPQIVQPQIAQPQIVQPQIVQPQIVQPQIVQPQAYGLDVSGAPGTVVTQVPQGSTPTVMVPGHGTGRSVAGYWVCANSAWYYYPLPPGAAPGEQLHADPSITGTPPGYAPGACVAGTMVQPEQPPVVMAPPPPVRRDYVVVQPPMYYPPPPPPPVYYAPPPPPPVYYAPPQRRGGVVLEFGVGPRRPFGRVRVRRGRRW